MKNWINAAKSKPKPYFYEDGMPKLYLCQILILDIKEGFKYSYRIGFVTEDNDWNIEVANVLHKVVRYLPCSCDDSNLEEDVKFNMPYFDKAMEYVMNNMTEENPEHAE